jgi:hypothetical protein
MEIDMTNTITYLFEEIAVIVNGVEYLATGTMPVEYTITVPDASVGKLYEDVEVEGCGEISADLADDNGDIITVTFQPGTNGHNHILRGISSAQLEEACLDDYFGR